MTTKYPRYTILSPVLVRARLDRPGKGSGPVLVLLHWCPGCKETHVVHDTEKNSSDAMWTWDGNAKRPTLMPSVNSGRGPFPDGRVHRCHYWLKAGTLECLKDSTHELAGRKVKLPPIPDELTQRWRADGRIAHVDPE